MYSERTGVKQNIQLGDLFHDHGPFLQGVYSHFRNSKLYNEDADKLLGDNGKGKMVKVVGRVKRWFRKDQVPSTQYWMEISTIWECGWDEVEKARGAICGW
ncbi:hypothetical protein DFH27DRAFT_546090 [Peziza echinospora]|nr:hypothetical protein DFH27DRAFT_546090 [Peziza echinospora]